MLKPTTPENEAQRLNALIKLGLLDTKSEERFDRLTRLARALFNVPIALISLVDENRQWFKSKQGLNACETGRDISFCGHAILNKEILQITDTLQDPKFADNPLVTGDPFIRFYAGAPLTTQAGFRIGTLCIIDTQPKVLDENQLQLLRDLAKLVETEFEQTLTLELKKELHKQKTFLRAVIDNVVDGIITINIQGSIETVNPAALNIFGYTKNEVINQNVKMLMPAPFHDEHDGYLKHYAQTGEKKIIGIGREVKGLRKDGTIFPLELAVSEMEIEGQRIFTGIIRDISERKEMEKTKEEFISTVSHELRTPLTSIKGALGLLTGGVAGDFNEKANQLLNMAQNNTERLLLLINDILDISKIEAGKMDFHFSEVNIADLISHAIEANTGYASEHQITFINQNTLKNAKIYGDSARLMQVMNNLMSNAAKFSDKNDAVYINATRHHNQIRISVTDHGPGISKPLESKIFEKFTQGDSSDTRQIGGTGLGLNITKAIIEKHNGRISFVSETGIGTTFYFDLPEIKNANLTSNASNRNDLQRVLICDDEPDIAALIRLMLAQAGFDSDIALNAAEAKKLLNKHHYDAMTLDIMLPDKDGVTLYQELRNDPQLQTLPIVFVSVKAKKIQRVEFPDGHHLTEWIDKPINDFELLNAVDSVISQKKNDPDLIEVLHVEDDPDIQKLVAMLLDKNYNLTEATTLTEARKVIAQKHNRINFDVILLDIGLPDGSGLDLLSDVAKLDHQPKILIFSADEIQTQSIPQIEGSFVKSKTSNEELIQKIKSITDNL